jgi:hypothetical protein
MRFNRVLPIIAETLLLPASRGSHIIVALAACVRPAPPALLSLLRARPDPACRRSRSVARESEPDPRVVVALLDPRPASLTPDPQSLWLGEVMEPRGSSRVALAGPSPSVSTLLTRTPLCSSLGWTLGSSRASPDPHPLLHSHGPSGFVVPTRGGPSCGLVGLTS